MRGLVGVLLLLVGCNEAFDLRQAVPIDASPIDAVPDAAVTCPPPGVAPKFSKVITQVVGQPCIDYSMSLTAQRAIASCYDPVSGARAFHEGVLDGPMMRPAPGFVLPPGYLEMDFVRLWPDGNTAHARILDNAGLNYRFVTYLRGSDGTWTPGPDLAIETGYGYSLSEPTSTSPRRVLWNDGDSYRFKEFVESSPGSWQEVGVYTTQDFGLIQFLAPRLSADGLRVILWGRGPDDHIYYVDRADVTQRFGAVQQLNVPPTFSAELSEDCKHIYFSAIGSIFKIEAQP